MYTMGEVILSIVTSVVGLVTFAFLALGFYDGKKVKGWVWAVGAVLMLAVFIFAVTVRLPEAKANEAMLEKLPPDMPRPQTLSAEVGWQREAAGKYLPVTEVTITHEDKAIKPLKLHVRIKDGKLVAAENAPEQK